MKRRLTDMIDKARALESRLAARFERTAERVAASATPKQPLEILHAIVAEIEREVQPAGRGQRTFPFNDIRISLVATSSSARARLDAICESPPSLRDRVVECLTAAGCAVSNLTIAWSFVEAPQPDWERPEYHIDLARVAASAASAPERRVELIVTKGVADRETYAFATGPIMLGRGAEVRDNRQQLLRVNHVVFSEGGGAVNHSVSRRHAHIELDRSGCRIYDDGSAQGTSVIRQGRGIAVPRGSRGLSLRSGDEVVLGEACLRVRVHDTMPSP